MKNKKLLLFTFLFFISSSLLSQSKKNFTLEELFAKRTFAAKSVEGFESLNNGEYYTSLIFNEDKEASITKFSFKTGEKVETIVEEKDLIVEGTNDSLIIEDYQFNPSETKILFSVTKERIYRYSSTNDYFVYDLQTKKLNKITDKPAMYAVFSPDGNKIAYVRENNLFYYDLIKNAEIQITTDGKKIT